MSFDKMEALLATYSWASWALAVTPPHCKPSRTQVIGRQTLQDAVVYSSTSGLASVLQRVRCGRP